MYLRSCRVMNCCRMDRVVGTERRPSLRLAAISAMVVRNAMKSGPNLPYVSMHIAMNKKCFSVASGLYLLFFFCSSLRTAAPSSVAVPEAHAYGLTPSIGWTMDTSPSTAITSFRKPVTHMSVMLSWSRSFALRACSFGPSSAAHLGVAWRPVPCLTILMSCQRTSLWQRVRLPNWLLYLQLIAWCFAFKNVRGASGYVAARCRFILANQPGLVQVEFEPDGDAHYGRRELHVLGVRALGVPIECSWS